MSCRAAFNISEFVPWALEQVLELFADGLIEFAGINEQRVRRYMDDALREDMSDIAAH